MAGASAGKVTAEPARDEPLWKQTIVAEQTMDRITLVRSTLRSDGPLYEVMEQALLGATP